MFQRSTRRNRSVQKERKKFHQRAKQRSNFSRSSPYLKLDVCAALPKLARDHVGLPSNVQHRNLFDSPVYLVLATRLRDRPFDKGAATLLVRYATAPRIAPRQPAREGETGVRSVRFPTWLS